MAQRAVPLAELLLDYRLYAFSSEDSYQNFKKNGRDAYHSLLLASEGREILGYPLFRAESGRTFLNFFRRDAPVLQIYKHVVLPFSAEPPGPEARLVALAGDRSLYRVPFCSVFSQQRFLSAISEYTLVFQRGGEPTYVRMRRKWTSQIYDTVFDGMHMRWHHRRLFSLLGGLSRKLVVLREDMPSLFAEMDDQCFSSHLSEKEISELSVLAEYTAKSARLLPSRVARVGELVVADTSTVQPSDFNQVPWNLEVIICMNLLITFLEKQKLADSRRRARNNSIHTMF